MGLLLALVLIVAQAQVPAPPPPSAGVSSPAAAFAGLTVVRVEVSIEGTVTPDATVNSLLETGVGQPLTMAAVRETIAHMWSLGRFQEITVDATAVEGGVALRYDLVPVHSVRRIEFNGNLGLGESALRRAVTDRFGAAPAAGRAASVAEMLQDFYFDRGYLAASIRPSVEEVHDPEGTILTFEIESGARASVRDVTITGDPGQPREILLKAIKAEPGRVYQRVEVQEQLTKYLESLRRRGRFEASGSHRIRSQSDDGRSVDLSISVEQGPAITVRYEGDQLPKDKLDELVPVSKEGSVDADILEDSERRIVSYLNQQGYWKASATAARRQADGRVEIVFTVRRGLQYRNEGEVQVIGNASVPIEEIRPVLSALDDGEIFAATSLSAAASAIRGIYLRRGFARVKVDAAATELNPSATGQGRIKPVIAITEGPRMIIGNVSFNGNAAVPTADLLARLAIAGEQPYYEPLVIQDRENILAEYLNRGFPTATVNVAPAITNESRVDIAFNIVEGPQSIVDHILIVGNVRTDPRVIEREIQLRTGEPLGLEALFETRRRLGALGLFRRIRITEIPHGDTDRRDILITVEESPSTTVGYGGGLELSQVLVTGTDGTATQQFELAPRGFFEVGRRNIAGKNRSVNLYTRVGLRSERNRQEGSGGALSFPEYRVVGTFREPRTFGWNADVTITGALEQGARSTFNFARKGVNAELQRTLSPRVRMGARYTFGTTRTFDEQLTEEEQATIDRAFPDVRLSSVSGSLVRDSRDDVIDPGRGFFLSAEGTLAARAMGGEVGFVKSYLQAQGYRRLPVGPRVVFAGRVAVGLADGFPRPDPDFPDEVIEDLPASERFFAGGDSTMRGFALDSVGAPNTISSSGFPRGGNGLILLNGELRVPVWKDVGAAFFIDAGNVFERVTQIDFAELRAAVGFGLRYRSPIGPLRFDVGFKLDVREVAGDPERRHAFHFSFGQAF